MAEGVAELGKDLRSLKDVRLTSEDFVGFSGLTSQFTKGIKKGSGDLAAAGANVGADVADAAGAAGAADAAGAAGGGGDGGGGGGGAAAAATDHDALVREITELRAQLVAERNAPPAPEPAKEADEDSGGGLDDARSWKIKHDSAKARYEASDARCRELEDKCRIAEEKAWGAKKRTEAIKAAYEDLKREHAAELEARHQEIAELRVALLQQSFEHETLRHQQRSASKEPAAAAMQQPSYYTVLLRTFVGITGFVSFLV
eukprot:g228.t1